MPTLTTAQTADLTMLSRDIHSHPELAYQERHALAEVRLGSASRRALGAPQGDIGQLE